MKPIISAAAILIVLVLVFLGLCAFGLQSAGNVSGLLGSGYRLLSSAGRIGGPMQVASDSSVKSSGAELSQQTSEQLAMTSDNVALSPLEENMFELVDQQRVKAGLSDLQLDNTLTQLARFRSQDMATKNYFSHIAPDGSSAKDLMIAARIGPGLMGEILGRNNSPDSGDSVRAVFDAFMNSPEHKGAIMNPRFMWAGVGMANGSDGMKYYCVLFFGP